MKNTHKYANPLEYDAGTLTSIMIERDYTLPRTICSTFEVQIINKSLSYTEVFRLDLFLICYIFDSSHIGLS